MGDVSDSDTDPIILEALEDLEDSEDEDVSDEVFNWRADENMDHWHYDQENVVANFEDNRVVVRLSFMSDSVINQLGIGGMMLINRLRIYPEEDNMYIVPRWLTGSCKREEFILMCAIWPFWSICVIKPASKIVMCKRTWRTEDSKVICRNCKNDYDGALEDIVIELLAINSNIGCFMIYDNMDWFFCLCCRTFLWGGMEGQIMYQELVHHERWLLWKYNVLVGEDALTGENTLRIYRPPLIHSISFTDPFKRIVVNYE